MPPPFQPVGHRPHHLGGAHLARVLAGHHGAVEQLPHHLLFRHVDGPLRDALLQKQQGEGGGSARPLVDAQLGARDGLFGQQSGHRGAQHPLVPPVAALEPGLQRDEQVEHVAVPVGVGGPVAGQGGQHRRHLVEAVVGRHVVRHGRVQVRQPVLAVHARERDVGAVPGQDPARGAVEGAVERDERQQVLDDVRVLGLRRPYRVRELAQQVGGGHRDLPVPGAEVVGYRPGLDELVGHVGAHRQRVDRTGRPVREGGDPGGVDAAGQHHQRRTPGAMRAPTARSRAVRTAATASSSSMIRRARAGPRCGGSRPYRSRGRCPSRCRRAPGRPRAGRAPGGRRRTGSPVDRRARPGSWPRWTR